MRIALFLAGMLCAVSAYALQDQTVPDPDYVIHHGVRYEAHNYGQVHGRDQNGGYVQAYDMGSGARLWEKQVYNTNDVIAPTELAHDVYIARIDVKDSVLYAITDGGHIFAFPLFYPDKKLDAQIGKEVTVKGPAMNFVDSAGVRVGDNVYLIDGMIMWPVGFEGNEVTVKGTLIKKPLLVKVDPRSSFRGDVDAFSYTLTKTNWSDNKIPTKDKNEINKELDPQYRNVVYGRENI